MFWVFSNSVRWKPYRSENTIGLEKQELDDMFSKQSSVTTTLWALWSGHNGCAAVMLHGNKWSIVPECHVRWIREYYNLQLFSSGTLLSSGGSSDCLFATICQGTWGLPQKVVILTFLRWLKILKHLRTSVGAEGFFWCRVWYFSSPSVWTVLESTTVHIEWFFER